MPARRSKDSTGGLRKVPPGFEHCDSRIAACRGAIGNVEFEPLRFEIVVKTSAKLEAGCGDDERMKYSLGWSGS
jgi:hypothetical protein